jgi:hypothetical protein
MVRSVFSPTIFLAIAADSIFTSLRDPAGLVAVGEGRGVFVGGPCVAISFVGTFVAAWVGVELVVSPAPQLDSNKPGTTIQMTTIKLICFMFMFSSSPSSAYPIDALVVHMNFFRHAET